MKKQYQIFASLAVAALIYLVPEVTHAAKLYLSPSSGTATVGSTVTVSVKVDTQGGAINVAEASISYSTDTLSLLSVAKGSTFYLNSPGSPSQGTGTAYFSGGLPTPGYTGTSGSVGVMTFRVKAVGPGKVNITSGQTLLNDGNGTDVLSGTSGAVFTLTETPTQQTQPASTGTNGPKVISSTHPEESGWYNKKDAILSWTRPTGAYGFSFILDQNAYTIPDTILDTTITTQKTFPDLKDGTWYFHINSRAQSANTAFSPVTHFKIQVDSAPPESFTINLDGEESSEEQANSPVVSFKAKDALSDIGSYQILLDDKIVQEKAQSPYTFESVPAGAHKITVIAFDKAGNSTKAEQSIVVPAEGTGGMPLVTLLLAVIGLLALIIIILAIMLKRRRSPGKHAEQVMAIQEQFDQGVQALKKHIDAHMSTLTAESSYSERQMREEIDRIVAATRTKVNKKLANVAGEEIKQLNNKKAKREEEEAEA